MKRRLAQHPFGLLNCRRCVRPASVIVHGDGLCGGCFLQFSVGLAASRMQESRLPARPRRLGNAESHVIH